MVESLRAEDKANMRLLSIVEKATPYGEQDGGFIAYYIIPTGPIHRAILHLQQHGYSVPNPPREAPQPLKVWRCRWCGRRVHGVWGWFHKPDKCESKVDNARNVD